MVAKWFGALDLKSIFPEFKSHSDHLLDLFQVLPGSAPKLNEQVVINIRLAR